MAIAKQKNTKPGEVEVPPEHVLVETVEGEIWDKGLLYYFSPNRVMEALKKAKWDTEEEIETIVDAIRDVDTPPNQKVSLIKLLRECVKEPLILTGAIRKVTTESVSGLDGTRVTKVSEESLGGLAVEARHRMDTLELLEAGASTVESITIGEEDEYDGSDACDDECGSDSRGRGSGNGSAEGGGSGSGGARAGPGLYEGERPDPACPAS